MAMRGQRFHIDLSSDDKADTSQTSKQLFTFTSLSSLVGDIKERSPSSISISPSPPQIKNSESGFPAHKKLARPSAFKKSRASQSAKFEANLPSTTYSEESIYGNRGLLDSGKKIDERQKIDEENKQRLAQMSPEEIEDARKELLTGLSPSLIEKLLRKANIDEGRTDSDIEFEPTDPKGILSEYETAGKQIGSINGREPTDQRDTSNSQSPVKQVTFGIPDSTPLPKTQPQTQPPARHSDLDLPPITPPPDLLPASKTPPPLTLSPNLPPAPTLDPSSPTFLSSLHNTYFPSLPSSPSSLSWLFPSTPSENASYSPSLAFLTPSALRFDFRAHLLPPRLADQIPTTKGLHHHAAAPDAAGYTIPELARLARSVVPAQRCMAFQTLGRLLYRLGRGDFGHEGELAEGLWGLMEEGKVVEWLVYAAAEEGGNRTCWVTATEAVWLWRKGGGRRLKAE